MTSDVDLLRQAVKEYEKATRVKNMNQELYDHLLGSIVYLLKYSEKYSIPLPQKDELYRMLNRAQSLIEGITDTNRQLTGRNTNREANSSCTKELLPSRWFSLTVNFGW